MLKKLLKAAVMGWLAKRLAGRRDWKRKRKVWGHQRDAWHAAGRGSRYGDPPYRVRPGLKNVVLGAILRRLGR